MYALGRAKVYAPANSALSFIQLQVFAKIFTSAFSNKFFPSLDNSLFF